MSKTKTVGEDIRERRLELGWSQMQLAANAGVSISTVYRVESGWSIPRPAILKAIYQALTGRF